jgi:hypothetical protein
MTLKKRSFQKRNGKSMNYDRALFVLSMSDEEAESLLDALGLLCGGQLIDLFYDVSGAHCTNVWNEDKEFEAHGMKMTQVVKKVNYTMSGDGWNCTLVGFDDYSEFQIDGHAMMLLQLIQYNIVDADTALRKLHDLRGEL